MVRWRWKARVSVFVNSLVFKSAYRKEGLLHPGDKGPLGGEGSEVHEICLESLLVVGQNGIRC